MEVYCQNYEESERGWGTRPDGHTLHLSRNDAVKFAQDYCRLGVLPQVPAEYSRPLGQLKMVPVDSKTLEELRADHKRGGLGIWGDVSRWR
jgi:hypothetical protein